MSVPLTLYLAEDHTAIREMLISHLGMMKGYRVVGQSGDGGKVLDECPSPTSTTQCP
jgi:DNA-binding NarL/FixJ family response regulator